jgi:hypothetical protein
VPAETAFPGTRPVFYTGFALKRFDRDDNLKLRATTIAGYVLLAGILVIGIYDIGQNLSPGQYPAMDPGYVDECGSCHMAYPPQLLPAASWKRIMQGLDSHFGENAEVDATTRKALQKYLVESSSSGSIYNLFGNHGEGVPSRITELPFFIARHDAIPARLIQDNDKVGSLSHCNACHQNAEQGRFDEDDVRIPGTDGRVD